MTKSVALERLSGCPNHRNRRERLPRGYLVRTLLSLRRLGRVSCAVRVVALMRDAQRAREGFVDVAGLPHHSAIDEEGTPEPGAYVYLAHRLGATAVRRHRAGHAPSP
jgi:hypothetical protein